MGPVLQLLRWWSSPHVGGYDIGTGEKVRHRSADDYAAPMLSRRRFVAGVASGLSLGGLTGPAQLLAASGKFELSEPRRRSLLAALAREDPHYDPFAKMTVAPAASGPGYHATLRTGDVRATRPSLVYAAALLDSGERPRIERAREILRSVLSLQEQDSASETYGVWPWCLEEPLAKMSPPDLDGTYSCAISLLMAWIGHREDFVAGLADQVREAILRTARSIQRRDVDPAHTHVAIMDTGVTLLAAQEFKQPDLRAHAKERLRKLHDFVMQQGSFTEYNSPDHLVIALQELSRMLWLVKDSRDLTLIRAIHDLAWKHAATHFHAPTRQWAGPHGESHETDLRKRNATLAFFQAGCGAKANFNLGDPLPLGLEACRLPLECPRKFVKHFVQLDAPRQVVETFIKPDPAQPGAANAVIGTTWLHPRFSLGSVNRGDFWAQRRPLLAYWGTAQAPRHLRARFLKDDRDFASALFFSAQHEGAMLAVVTFATDLGDKHPSLDPIKDGTIRARDLRLRFEIGGELGTFTVRTAGDAEKFLVLQDRDVRFVLRPVADSFADTPLRWDFPGLKLAEQLDATIHHGEEKTFHLPSLNEAFICFTFQEWPYDQKQPPMPKVELQRGGGRLRACWQAVGRTLEIDAAIKPAPYAQLNDSLRARVT